MIFDQLNRSPRYIGLHKKFDAAFHYLASQDFSAVEPGRIDLEGDNLYAMVQAYTTRTPEQGIWEAHRRYIDVQYIISGRERILFAPIEQMQLGIYIPERDFLPLTGNGSTLDLSASFFVIFYPEDAHMPGLAIDFPEPVKKVVVKVAV
jgi:YhcH/YjgK/YiaL family protein